MRYKLFVAVIAMILVLASEAAAVTWSAPVDLSVAGQNAESPQVTGSADGSTLTSVWRRFNGSNYIIQASTSTDSGATWSAPFNLSAAGQNAYDPQVTGSADGSKLTSVWGRYNGSNYIIQASTSTDSGVTWSAPFNLSAAGQNAYDPQVTGSADGSKLTSVWRHYNGSNYIIQASTSTDSGATWSAPVNLSAAGQNAYDSQVTGSADGSKLTSVWRRFNGINYIIQASTSTDSGATWSAPVSLSAAGQHAYYPQVTGSADGSKLTSVWERYNVSNMIIQASTSTDSGVTWSAPVSLSAAGQDANHSQVTGSADGSKLTSVWERYNGSNFIIQASTSTDSGANWSAPVSLSAAGQDANHSQVTGSADGSKLTSVWQGLNGDDWIIQASTSTDSGATWSAPVNLSAAGQNAYDSQVTGSADGSKLTSVWRRFIGSNWIIQSATLWTRSGSGMFYVIPNKNGGAAVIYLE